MSEVDNKPSRGGARPGSGRKPTGKKMVSKRLAPDVVAILEQQDDATDHLEAAVRYYARRPISFVPAVADVLAYMHETGLSQDDAVRALGGKP